MPLFDEQAEPIRYIDFLDILQDLGTFISGPFGRVHEFIMEALLNRESVVAYDVDHQLYNAVAGFLKRTGYIVRAFDNPNQADTLLRCGQLDFLPDDAMLFIHHLAKTTNDLSEIYLNDPDALSEEEQLLMNAGLFKMCLFDSIMATMDPDEDFNISTFLDLLWSDEWRTLYENYLKDHGDEPSAEAALCQTILEIPADTFNPFRYTLAREMSEEYYRPLNDLNERRYNKPLNMLPTQLFDQRATELMLELMDTPCIYFYETHIHDSDKDNILPFDTNPSKQAKLQSFISQAKGGIRKRQNLIISDFSNKIYDEIRDALEKKDYQVISIPGPTKISKRSCMTLERDVSYANYVELAISQKIICDPDVTIGFDWILENPLTLALMIRSYFFIDHDTTIFTAFLEAEDKEKFLYELLEDGLSDGDPATENTWEAWLTFKSATYPDQIKYIADTKNHLTELLYDKTAGLFNVKDDRPYAVIYTHSK